MSRKDELIAELAELSVQLGKEIVPGKNIADIEAQINELKGVDDKQEQSQVKVMALKTVWTEFDGIKYRLIGGQSGVWPKELAEQESENGHVTIM